MIRVSAAVALACLSGTVAGCSSGAGQDCEPGGSALVSATGPDGRTWETTTEVTLQPPSVGSGYVIVRHPCGWTALDLEDGTVVREGEGTAVGVAGGFVYTLADDGETVDGEAIEEGASSGDLDGITIASPGRQRQAYTVDEHLYVLPRDDGGPVSLTQYVGGGENQWDTTLPVVREPTLTPVAEVLVVTSSEGSVYGVDLDSGTVLWRTLVTTVEATSQLSVRARGDQAVVTARSAGGPASVVVLDPTTGDRLDRSAAPDPAEPVLSGMSDGWRVDIESDPIYVMEE